MSNLSTKFWTARWILPICAPAINGGWIAMRGNRVLDLGSGSAPEAAQDLGDVALLPGLINAHTHLEFSGFQTPVGHQGIELASWIGQVIEARQDADTSTVHHAIRQGMKESIGAGVRLIVDIATAPPAESAVPQALSIVSLAEVLGLSAQRSTPLYEAAQALIERDPLAGVSPHAPYSVPPATLERCVSLARTQKRPLAMHVAECPAERELLVNGRGPFRETFEAMGIWDSNLFPWGPNPFDKLWPQLAQAPHGLVVHGNDLQGNEIESLAKHSNLTVVYCPRTHHFFRHAKHPVQQMLSRGVPVALGTDSRASNPDLDLWKEAQFLLNHRQDIAPSQVLEMATRSGADAVGMPQLGRLEPDAQPGLTVIPTTAVNLDGLYADLSQQDANPFHVAANETDSESSQ